MGIAATTAGMALAEPDFREPFFCTGQLIFLLKANKFCSFLNKQFKPHLLPVYNYINLSHTDFLAGPPELACYAFAMVEITSWNKIIYEYIKKEI